jgi:hypothetical protein
MNVHMGIIATPPETAQAMAEEDGESGNPSHLEFCSSQAESARIRHRAERRSLIFVGLAVLQVG